MKQEYENKAGTAGSEAKMGLAAQFAERYESWTPPMRFLLWLGLGLILYFGVIERAFVQAGSFGAAADESAAKMQTISQNSGRDRESVQSGRAHWGEREVPEIGAPGGSYTDLQKAIDDVLKVHSVYSGVTFKDMATGDLKRAPGGQDNTNGRGVLNLKMAETQVQFTAAPSVVMAVLADLEKSPIVACLQRVSLNRIEARKVLEVTLVAQSWKRN